MSKAKAVVKPGGKVWLDKLRSLQLGKLIKSGGAGSVYLLPDAPGQVAKLYHPHIDHEKSRRKIEAMLDLLPELPDKLENGRRYVQIAWPQSALHDGKQGFIGFAMPLLELAQTAELEQIMQERQARAAGLPTGLGPKLTLAANLAAVIDALHQQQHYVVDLKPVNLRFYRDSLYIAMLDCDGFSIQGRAERFPAEQFTADYLAPEFQRKGMQPGREPAQDRFALAVVIFQLLNFGIHPYSGRPANSQVATDLPGRIRDGCYAYGVQSNKAIAPNATSGHVLMPDELRVMFDRAFSRSPHPSRPSAQDWSQLLRGYAQKSGGLLTVCAVNPEHQHFTGFACAACAREQVIAQAARQAQAQPQPPVRQSRRQAAPAVSMPMPVPAAGTPVSGKGWAAVVIVIVLAVVGFTMWNSTPDRVAERTQEVADAETRAGLEQLNWRERKAAGTAPSDMRKTIRLVSQALTSGDEQAVMRGLQLLFRAQPDSSSRSFDRTRERLRETLMEGPGWLPGVQSGLGDQLRDQLIENPRDHLTASALGRIHLAYNEPVASRQYFEQAIWAEPTDGPAWIGMAAAAMRANNEADAVNLAAIGFVTAQRFASRNAMPAEEGEALDNGVARTNSRMERAGKILQLAQPRSNVPRWEKILKDGQALAERIHAMPPLPAQRAAVALPVLPQLIYAGRDLDGLHGDNTISMAINERGEMTQVASAEPMDPRLNKLLLAHLKKWPFTSAVENGQVRNGNVEVLLRYRDGKMLFSLPAPLPPSKENP